MTTPLPPRTAANDRRIENTPFEQLTARQKQYADMHGLTLRAPVPGPGLGDTVYYEQPANPPPVGSIGGTAPTPEQSAGLGIISGPSVAQPAAPILDSQGNDVTGQYVDGVYYPPGATPPARADAAADPAKAAEDLAARERAEARAREQRDAYVRLASILEEYGLGSLGAQIQEWLVGGLSEAEITQRIRDTDQFKQRFPAIEARKRGGLGPISPAEYLAYEKQARQMFRSAGLPPGFYDTNDDFTGFLSKDVSIAELTDRVGLASNAAFNADASVKQALTNFGMSGGDLTAFFLDPDVAQPLLERKYNSARLSAAGNRTGFGFLEEGEAVGLLQAGVTEGAATQGFSDLAGSRELFGALDVGEDEISRGEQLGATFTGNASARRRIQQRTRRRQAAFEGGGSFVAGERGVVGLGDAAD